MKKIINGRLYDTDTAKLIGRFRRWIYGKKTNNPKQNK